VLTSGGVGTGTPGALLTANELFDPATGTFTATDSLVEGR
jgi:hypothetical protein